MNRPEGSVLVINAGSSSLKYQLLQPDSGVVSAKGLIEQIGEGGGQHRHWVAGDEQVSAGGLTNIGAALAALRAAFARHGPDLQAHPPIAVGHRVVHGGTRFERTTRIDESVLAGLRELNPLAPLHNPANIAGIEAALAQFPDVPQFAVFDTAFHATLPPAAYTYAVPRAWREEYGVRRYGFHGTSHQYVAGRVAALRGRSDLATVVLHLGNGASACAVLDGRSVETSMGMTPLEGLVMGTRSGDLDPAIPFHVARSAGLDIARVERALNADSGLKGLTGDNDFRSVAARATSGDPNARAAIDVVTHRLVKYVGAYAATMGRLDAIAFTGGIGEHNPALRADVLARLGLFGVVLDSGANERAVGESVLTAPGSPVTAYVIPTNEEQQIARECLAQLP